MDLDVPKPASSTRGEHLPRLVVAIGASAGGLDACKKFFAAMPEASGFAFIVVMHLDPAHESHIAEILGATTGMPVAQVSGDQRLEPDHVYVMAPDSTLQVRKGVLHPEKPHEHRERRKPIDSLFSSLAADQNRRAVAIVFSGAGDDGSSGILKVNAAGGLCIAQDPETAQYDSMPRSALAAGVVDHVLSLEQIPAVLLDFAERPDDSGAGPVAGPEPAVFSSILETLGTRYGLAFGAYKKGTLKRRTERRMALQQSSGWQDYLEMLRESPDEVEALYRDLLIGVTSFFRDADVWEYIENDVIPVLLAEKRGEGPIRIWVPACATGEEAYSFAIVALERLAGTSTKLQIYATDVSEQAVATARRGVYPGSIASQVSPERLQRFFRQEGENFHLVPEVRDTLTFAVHNLLVAPPFSRLDLVSCRNLLIYLEPPAQDAILELFHFALQPDGLLLLGKSETIGRCTDLYDPVSKKHHVYRANALTRFDRYHVPSWLDHRASTSAPAQSARQTSGKTARLVEQFVLNRRAPACVAINRSFEVLYLFGPTHDYLVQPTGEVRLDLLSWVRPGLYAKLRAGLQAAVESGQPVTLSDMRVERGDASVRVDCAIEPIAGVPGAEGLFLVVFRDTAPPSVASADAADRSDEPFVRELEAELKAARQELRIAVEQLDGTNEEYRASNEELISLNEELQSSNEELETSKEELQSLNEEIVTINRQLEEKNAELRTLNADLANFLVSTEVPTIFLDRELRIRRFTPAATEVMRLVVSDVGRSIEHVKERFHDERLLDDIARVLEKLVPLSAELQTEDGRWYLRKALPYRSLDDRIDGVTITFGEITAQKRAVAELDEAKRFSEAIVETVRTPLLVLDDELCVVSANSCFLETFRTSRAEVETRKLYELGNGQWDIPALRTLLGEVLPESRAIDNYVVELEFEELGHRVVLLNARQMAPGAGRPLILIAIEDVTHRYDSERVATRRSEELAEEHRRKDEFLAMLGHELRNPLSALTHGIELSGKVGDDRERSAKLREMMARQAKRIGTLLDELLDVARVVTGKIEIARDRVELTGVVRRAVETMTPFIESHDQKITLELPADDGIFALGDATRLSQVVENLLTNAAKYSKPGGQIRLALEASADEVRIAIRDTGVGIDPEFLPRVFDLFTQAPRQLSRSEGGLGLGLPLVRRLVELHGGHVVASSPGIGRGSEFVVTLPRLSERRSTEAIHETVVRPRRILVVDDEPDIAEALAELLEHEGHQVLAVHDGRAALDAVTTFKPEVVLLDLGLPRMDGYEVAKRLRETSGGELLIIALTGYNKDAARLERAGFDRHLIKPPQIQTISELLAASPSR